MAQEQETIETAPVTVRSGAGGGHRLRVDRPVVSREGFRQGREGQRQIPSPARVMVWMVITILLVIVGTEIVEGLHHESEIIEGITHIITLIVTLVPIFYFLWYRPLCRQTLELQRSEREIRDLSHQLLMAGEEERCKLARDLHDEFGQKLTSLQMRLESLAAAIELEYPQGETLVGHCRQLAAMTGELGDDLRLVVADLRPDLLQELGIRSALEVFFGEIRKQCPELRIDFTCSGLRERAPTEIETVLYRVVQEAVNNILKHARAKTVTVRLAASYPQLILSIQDDGVGFELPGNGSTARLEGFGLVGMRERVASLGGHLVIASRAGKGTRIRVELPLAGKGEK